MSGVKLSLSFGQRRFLLMLADRGRRVRMFVTEKAVGRAGYLGVLSLAGDSFLTGQIVEIQDDGRRVLWSNNGSNPDGRFGVQIPPVPLITLTPLLGTDGEFDVVLNEFGSQIVEDMKVRFQDEVKQARADQARLDKEMAAAGLPILDYPT